VLPSQVNTPSSEGTKIVETRLAALSAVQRVIDGADDALSMMEKVPVGPKNRPLEPMTLQKVGGVGSPYTMLILSQVTIHANPFAK